MKKGLYVFKTIMSIGSYKIRDKEAIHFIPFVVVEWVDVSTRKASSLGNL
jgi:hypothetical protein